MAVASVALFGGGLACVPTVAQAATVTCNDGNVVVTAGGTIEAGFYSGNNVVPSSTQVTSAGLEAQCILIWRGYSVGTFDGVFGPKSQAALKLFQAEVNKEAGYKALSVDGSCGPQTWPYLRAYWWGPVGY